jgi:hypothetical protein
VEQQNTKRRGSSRKRKQAPLRRFFDLVSPSFAVNPTPNLVATPKCAPALGEGKFFEFFKRFLPKKLERDFLRDVETYFPATCSKCTVFNKVSNVPRDQVCDKV